MFAALTNHLWQSTIFALVVALITLAFRKNRANIRYALWLAASQSGAFAIDALAGHRCARSLRAFLGGRFRLQQIN